VIGLGNTEFTIDSCRGAGDDSLNKIPKDNRKTERRVIKNLFKIQFERNLQKLDNASWPKSVNDFGF
jgi:type I site-specific restriction-modification system R (restriction) subunit